jgi:hypothetical protein
MAGGSSGGTTKQINQPWEGAQPYLNDQFSRAQQLSNQNPSYFNGPLTIGALPSEQAAFNQQNSYNQSVFGGQPNLNYGAVTGSVGDTLTGQTGLGSMAGTLAPNATNLLTSGFNGPSQVSGGFNAADYAPQFGKAGGLDATGAYQSALSGTPDYSAVDANANAANQKIVQQFNEQVMPSLNERATFTNNMTGGIKSLNSVLPKMGEQMQSNILNAREGERQRALTAQQQAAGQVAQGGMQSYGLGLDQAGMNFNQASTNANLQDRYRADLLNYGSLAGQLSGQAGSQALTAAGLSPSVYDLGNQQNAGNFQQAAWQRGLQEDQLAAEQDKFNYLRDQPYDNLSWYGSQLNGIGGLGGTQTTQANRSGSSRAAGTLGGAMSGAAAGATWGASSTGPFAPYGALIGGLGGALAGYFS